MTISLLITVICCLLIPFAILAFVQAERDAIKSADRIVGKHVKGDR